MISVELMGGLGNQMFQYATGKANSLKYGKPLILDLSFLLKRKVQSALPRDYCLGDFKLNTPTASFVPRKYFRVIKEVRPLQFNTLYKNLYDNTSRDKDIYLSGFFQREVYFKEIRDTLIHDFSLETPLKGGALDVLREINNTNSICVHVRRTDYVNNKVYKSLDENYINSGLSSIEKKTRDPTIFIFSDDIAWCKNNLSFDSPHLFIEDALPDLRPAQTNSLMSQCKHFVISNSTFSWWAAWLSQNPSKNVVAPEYWRSDKKSADLGLVPEEWICL